MGATLPSVFFKFSGDGVPVDKCDVGTFGGLMVGFATALPTLLV